jgi:[FeFe] hydrogenase H-cluster maturation GTPase HydF
VNTTPKSERPHITFFGRRNSGKSSLFNAVTGQKIATVSEQAGTTTDPVYKMMELHPVGPVAFIDTAGMDDSGALGVLRVEKTREAMGKTDLAVLVIDGEVGFGLWEAEIKQQLDALAIRVVTVINKNDLVANFQESDLRKWKNDYNVPEVLEVSAVTGVGIEELKSKIAMVLQDAKADNWLLKDLLQPGDQVVLVVPVDTAAPKGRLILPQVQVLREVLDAGAVGVVCQVGQLKDTLDSVKEQPKLVVTDSQVFHEVATMLAPQVPLTSFSILMARYKGEMADFIAGAQAVEQLKPGAKVLIAEACTHQKQHQDIGTVKIPRLLQQRIGGKLDLRWVSGGDFPRELTEYQLIIHCGGCMLTRREVLSRLQQARSAGIPVINYGILLAQLNGILERAIAPLQGRF